MTTNAESATPTPRTDDLTKRVQYLMHVYKIDNGDILYREMSAAIANELTAARADAERYRWLREHTDSMSVQPPLTVALVKGWGLDAWSGDNLDAAIDEAIRGGQHG